MRRPRGPRRLLGGRGGHRTAILPGGWLRTGDIMRRRDSFLWMADRKRELILTGGFNVYPSQAEAAIRPLEGVADVAVMGCRAAPGTDSCAPSSSWLTGPRRDP